MDTVRAAESNGLKVPKEFDDPETRATLENAICHEWFSGYCASHSLSLPPSSEFASNLSPSPLLHPLFSPDTSTEVRTLAMGRLLSDLSSALSHSIASPASPANPKMSINSCHDTTLAGMLATLGVFDHKWPGFTSHVSVELFKGTGDDGLGWGEWAGKKLGGLIGREKKKEATHCLSLLPGHPKSRSSLTDRLRLACRRPNSVQRPSSCSSCLCKDRTPLRRPSRALHV